VFGEANKRVQAIAHDPFRAAETNSPKKVGGRAWNLPTPLAKARPKRSSDPDGEDSRRDRRGRRGVLGGGGRDLHRSRFQQLPWSTESVSLKIPPQSRLQSMDPTHPDRLVENVTAPSAGGFPGPDGEVRLRMRLPFRTGSSQWLSEKARSIMRCLQAMVVDPSDHCRNRGRGRNRDRNRFLFWLAPGPHRLLKLHGRVVSTPQ
jgi:hypothetical protein